MAPIRTFSTEPKQICHTKLNPFPLQVTNLPFPLIIGHLGMCLFLLRTCCAAIAYSVVTPVY